MRSILLLLLSVAARLGAETVVFGNGDRISGEWLRLEAGKIVLKNEYLGEVSIPASKVKSFEANKRAVISLKDGRIMRGSLGAGSSGQWSITTGRDTYTLAPELIESAVPQEPHEPKSLRAILTSLWKWTGNANAGYNLLRGERQSGTLSLGLNATLGQPDVKGLHSNWRTTYTLNALITNTRSGTRRISANSATSGLRQDFFFTPNNFLFALGQLEHIEPQLIALRQTYGIGVGRDIFRNPRQTVSFIGGTTYVNEQVQAGGRRQIYSEALLGGKISFALTEHVKLAHQFSFYPNLTQRGDYRFDTTSTLTTRLSNRLSINVTLIDKYLTLQLPGRTHNQLVFTTGLGVRLN